MTKTEDWKAGKLDVGFYYVKGADGMFGVMSDYALYKVNLSHPDNEITLLSPVPTYAEHKAMQAAIQNGESAIDTNKRLCKKIEELRTLLKECQAHLSLGEIGTSVTPINILIDSINAALGESEE